MIDMQEEPKTRITFCYNLSYLDHFKLGSCSHEICRDTVMGYCKRFAVASVAHSVSALSRSNDSSLSHDLSSSLAQASFLSSHNWDGLPATTVFQLNPWYSESKTASDMSETLICVGRVERNKSLLIIKPPQYFNFPR